MSNGSSEDLNRFKSAYEDEFDFYEENLLTLNWYANRVIASVSDRKHLRVLSLGIGHGIVPNFLLKGLEGMMDEYTIIDGASDIVDKFRGNGLPPYVRVLLNYFESFSSKSSYDVIDMGHVLEHVEDPDLIVEKYRHMLVSGGRLFMAVPNAASLHRMIGYEAGLLDSMYRLSQQDLELGHKRYFDYQSFTALVLRHGLKIVAAEGIFLKPVTTMQLNQLRLPASVWNAFLKLGQKFPAISNSILIEATI